MKNRTIENKKSITMKTIIILILAILFYSCSTQKCYPSKRSKDYAVRQWIKERSDGYFVVTTYKGFKKATVHVFECKPDSATLARL